MKPKTMCFFFMLMGCLLLGYGIYTAINQFYFNSQAVKGTGVVIQDTSRPVIEFITPQRRRIHFSASISSNPPPYALGVKVNVLYLPDNPQMARIDTFGDKWLPSIFIFVGGLISFFTPFFMYKILAKADRKKASLKQQGKKIVATYFQTIAVNFEEATDTFYQIYCYWIDPDNPKDMYLYIVDVDKDPRPDIAKHQIKEIPFIIDASDYTSYEMESHLFSTMKVKKPYILL